MTNGMHETHPEAAKRLEELKEELEVSGGDPSNGVDDLSFDETTYQELLRDKTHAGEAPSAENILTRTLALAEKRGLSNEQFYELLDTEIAYEIARTDTPAYGGKESKTAQATRVDKAQVYATLVDEVDSLIRERFQTEPAQADETKTNEPQTETQPKVEKPTPANMPKKETRRTAQPPNAEVNEPKDDSSTAATAAKSESKASTNVQDSQESDENPAQVAAPAESVSEKITSAPSEKAKRTREEIERGDIERGVLAFGLLRDENISIAQINMFRAEAKKAGMYTRIKGPKSDTKRLKFSYPDRLEQAKQIARARFEEMYVADGVMTKQLHAQRERFVDQAAHLMALGGHEFEAARKRFKELTEIDISQPALAGTESQGDSVEADSDSLDQEPVTISTDEKLQAIDKQFNGLLGEIAATRVNTNYLMSEHADIKNRLDSMGDTVTDKNRKNLTQGFIRKNLYKHYFKINAQFENDQARRDHIEELSSLYLVYELLSDEERSQFNDLLELRDETINGPKPDAEQPQVDDGSTVKADQDSVDDGPIAHASNRRYSVSNMYNSLYTRAGARIYQTRQNWAEKQRNMTPEEREKAKKRRAIIGLGAIAAAVSVVYLSKYGFDLPGGDETRISGGNVGEQDTGTFPPESLEDLMDGSDESGSIDGGTSESGGGSGNGSESSGDNSGGGGDRNDDNLSRNETFDGQYGSRRLTPEAHADMKEYLNNRRVRSGDTVWSLAEDYLKDQGIDNPTRFEVDATKDVLLKDLKTSGNADTRGWLTAGDKLRTR